MQRINRLKELVKRPFFNKQAYVLFERRATPEEWADHLEYKKLCAELEAEVRELPVGTKVVYLTGTSNNEVRFGTILKQPEPNKFACEIMPLSGKVLNPTIASITWMEKMVD